MFYIYIMHYIYNVLYIVFYIYICILFNIMHNRPIVVAVHRFTSVVEVEEKKAEEHIHDSASQSARPGTYGNPEQEGRPGGVPSKKCGGKTGCRWRHPQKFLASQQINEADSIRKQG